VVQFQRLRNQQLAQFLEDVEIAHLVRIGQRQTRDAMLDAHVVKPLALGAEASLHIAQGIAVSQLRVGHAQQLAPHRKPAHVPVALIALDFTLKLTGQ
jgi:hypothetical protein